MNKHDCIICNPTPKRPKSGTAAPRPKSSRSSPKRGSSPPKNDATASSPAKTDVTSPKSKPKSADRQGRTPASPTKPSSAGKVAKPSSPGSKAVKPTSAGGKAAKPSSAGGKAAKPSSAGGKAVKPSSAGKAATSSDSAGQQQQAPVGGSHASSAATGKRLVAMIGVLKDKGLTIVELAQQGLTSVPTSLVTRKDAGYVNLASNNIRCLTPDISQLQSLVVLDLSRNALSSANANDFSGLPRELGTMTSLEMLVLSECNLAFIPPAVWLCTNLTLLDVSRNRINVLPPDVGNLEKLRHLNVQQTNISTLPAEIALCQELEEIMLWGNALDNLPDTLKEMPSLTLLALNFRSFSAVVDDYMANLLQKRQIQSEHIPPVVFEIPSLNTLDLEATKLNTLPAALNSKLTELCLARNYFREVPVCVTKLRHLRVLDLSDNLISTVSDEVRKLRALKRLNLRNNSISALPKAVTRMHHLIELNMGGNSLVTLPPDIGELKRLRKLILDRNQLQCLPDSIATLNDLDTLDLTKNRLRELPTCLYQMQSLSALHVYRQLHKHGLWLHQNPLIVPPPQVWQTDDIRAIYDYLRRYEIRQTADLQRLKVIVLGARQCGKTSLVKSIVSRLSRRTKTLVDSTRLAEYTPWTTPNDVDVTFIDLGSDESYIPLLHIFLHPQALYLLTYNHQTYKSEQFYEKIGFWLNMIYAYAPDAVVKLVGTNIDDMTREDIDNIKAVVIADLSAHIRGYIEKLQTTASKPLDTGTIGHASIKRLAAEANLANVSSEVSLVSSAEGIEGVHDLTEDIERLAVSKSIFPHLHRAISAEWKALQQAVKRSKSTVLLAGELKRMAKNCNVEQSEIPQFVEYLNSSGDVLYFDNNPDLGKIIFHQPRLLIQALHAVFNHDQSETLNFLQNHVLLSEGNFNPDSFELARDSLIGSGFLSNRMLRCLWFYLQFDNQQFEQMKDIIVGLKLAQAIAEPENLCYNEPFVPTLRVLSQITSLSANEKSQEKDFTDTCATLSGRSKMVLTLPLFEPPGLYQQTMCAVHHLVSEYIMIVANSLKFRTSTGGYVTTFRDTGEASAGQWYFDICADNSQISDQCRTLLVGDIVQYLDCYPGLTFYLTLG